MAGITGGVQLLDFAFFLKKKLSFTLHRAEKSSKWAPNFSYIILGSEDLEAKIRPNQCIYSFPCTQCGCTYNYQSLCHEISLLQLLKNIKTFDFSENWLSNSINPNLAPTVRLQGK